MRQRLSALIDRRLRERGPVRIASGLGRNAEQRVKTPDGQSEFGRYAKVAALRTATPRLE
jgi:hypothetical protein